MARACHLICYDRKFHSLARDFKISTAMCGLCAVIRNCFVFCFFLCSNVLCGLQRLGQLANGHSLDQWNSVHCNSNKQQQKKVALNACFRMTTEQKHVKARASAQPQRGEGSQSKRFIAKNHNPQ